MTLRNPTQHHRRVNRSADCKPRLSVNQISSCLPIVLQISAKTNVSLDLSLANTGIVHSETIQGVAVLNHNVRELGFLQRDIAKSNCQNYNKFNLNSATSESYKKRNNEENHLQATQPF